jgi:hypothetical protein
MLHPYQCKRRHKHKDQAKSHEDNNPDGSVLFHANESLEEGVGVGSTVPVAGPVVPVR